MRVFDYIEQGGPIMYLLVLVNIIGFALLFWKIVLIMGTKKRPESLEAIVKERVKSLGVEPDPSTLLTLVKEQVHIVAHELEAGLNTIKIIASIAPLLGLLGTVLGILSAFRVISEQGMSDPSLFAGGIAMALITTVGGLIVAIPHFVGYNYLVGVLDDLEIEVERKVVKEILSKES